MSFWFQSDDESDLVVRFKINDVDGVWKVNDENDDNYENVYHIVVEHKDQTKRFFTYLNDEYRDEKFDELLKLFAVRK